MSTAVSPDEPAGPRQRVLWVSTIVFTMLFAVWLMLGVLGLEMKKDAVLMLGAEAAETLAPEAKKAAIESRFEWLLATAILSGAIFRLTFGIWADKYGGRTMMVLLLLVSAVPTYLIGQATSYAELLACAALFGLAGNSFTVGIAWNSAWFPDRSKGTALGVFGAGNVGASGTKILVILVPSVLTLVPVAGYAGGWIPGGWRFVPTMYAALLVLAAIATLVLTPKTDRKPGRGRTLTEMLAPLKYMRVWRFGLYYVVVFGAYVALSAWLPNYYKTNYFADRPAQEAVQLAALMTAAYIFPAGLLRPLGGWLSDLYGPRVVTYAVFIVMTLATIPLCLPSSVLRLDVWSFTALMFVVGVGMGIGKASVYKYVPNYFPNDVGAVGGLVGALGALGGFFLPPMFGMLGRTTGSPQAAFYALLGLTVGSLVWLHVVVLRLKAASRAAATGTTDAAANREPVGALSGV
ncbi:MFS transporter [Fimbriiglobus ruber]|nr:MFS transporter [Fimbriiglobus ruber]